MTALKIYYKYNDLRQHKHIILQFCTCWASCTGFVMVGYKAQAAACSHAPREHLCPF